jgi:ankyrin repeat protein
MRAFLVTLLVIGCAATISAFVAFWYFDINPIRITRAEDNMPIPHAADARTQNDYFKEKHAWITRLILETHDTNTASSAHAVAEKNFLAKVCQAIVFPTSTSAYKNLALEGEQIISAGSNDPLVRLWYGQMLFYSQAYDAAEPFLRSAYDLDQAQYPWIHSFYALSSLAHITALKKDGPPGEFKNHMLNALIGYCQSVACGEFKNDEAHIAVQLLNDTYTKNYNIVKYGFILDCLKGRDHINEWYYNMLLGLLEIDLAWQARGTGFAKDVSPDGWKGFAEHMGNANGILRATWQDNPKRPEAATAMIQVAMGGHAESGETVNTWFNRAVQAQMDYPEAYTQMLFSLRPRWSGSHQKMLAFGESCLATNRFDTDVPLLYLYALRAIGSEQSNNRWRLPFRHEKVRANLQRLFSNLIQEPGRKAEVDRILTQQALTTAWSGDYATARQLLRKAGDGVCLRDGFWGKGLSWNTRQRQVLDAEYQLFTGTQSELLVRAEKLEMADKPDEASLLYEQAMHQCDDLQKRDYLRDRIAALRLGKTSEEIGIDPLFTAVYENAIELVTFLLDNGIEIDRENMDHWTPLYVACREGHTHLALILISRGAELNHKVAGNFTPLHAAITKGKTDIAHLLIERGADINASDTGSYTPLTTAIYFRHPELAKFLIERGADIEIKSYGDWAPLHQALNHDQPDIAMLLINRGAHLNERTSDGWLPLHLAANHGFKQVVQHLIAKGCDVNEKLPDGRTALMLAQQRQFADIVDLLQR